MPDTAHFSDSEESFHSFNDDDVKEPSSLANSKTKTSQAGPTRNPAATAETALPAATSERFPPEEEASLLSSSNSLKTTANALFSKGSYENAVQTYDRALATCPNYLDYELAVLRSNVAACHLQLQEWKEAVESATKGIDCLERLEPLPKAKEVKRNGAAGDDEGEAGGELVEEVDDAAEKRMQALQDSGHTLSEVRKLQVKLLQRRARARASLTPSTWASLQGADEDYRTLLHPSLAASISESEKRVLVTRARELLPRLNDAKDREMKEMMDKLKGLGNGLLKPFGLSTDMFKFEKQEGGGGGYTMNFDQGRKSK